MINEDTFIQKLCQHFPAKEPLVGIGDDCAVIPNENGEGWLVTTDALVEKIHFIKNQIPPFDLGYKTVSVNVSDIAAMGGTPKYAFLSIAIPKDTDCAWISEVVRGLKQGCQKWGLSLLGGDTVGSKSDIFLNLTLIGTAPLSNIKYRNQAKVGDIICVTGHLGDALGGLKILLNKIPPNSNAKQSLLKSHFHPEPHLHQGIWLGGQKEVHAMMDVSDGINCDLSRLLRCSQCGASVDVSRIPVSKSLLEVSQQQQWDPLEVALNGGEDYKLLFTAAPDGIESLKNVYETLFETSFYEIGVITNQVGELTYKNHNQPFIFKKDCFDHFK